MKEKPQKKQQEMEIMQEQEEGPEVQDLARLHGALKAPPVQLEEALHPGLAMGVEVPALSRVWEEEEGQIEGHSIH